MPPKKQWTTMLFACRSSRFFNRSRNAAAFIPTAWIRTATSRDSCGVNLRKSTDKGKATTPPPSGVLPAMNEPRILSSDGVSLGSSCRGFLHRMDERTSKRASERVNERTSERTNEKTLHGHAGRPELQDTCTKTIGRRDGIDPDRIDDASREKLDYVRVGIKKSGL